MSEENVLQRMSLTPRAPAVAVPHATEALRTLLSDDYEVGKWEGIVEQVEGPIADLVKEIPQPMLSGR